MSYCRSIVSSSLALNMYDVLLHNDQLRSNMKRSLVLQNFTGTLSYLRFLHHLLTLCL